MFRQNGVLAVSNRAIALRDTAGLRAIAAPPAAPAMQAA
jgi:CRP/FNR family transcriptional regulator